MSKELFSSYYRRNYWRGKESVSGPGSDYEQTKFLVPELQHLLQEFKIKSILDVPCGDFNWMRNINMDGIEYHGGDIVDELIKQNNKLHGKSNIKFSTIDIINDQLPQVDLIMVRDCLVHLSNDDITKAFTNIKNSNSKYLLVTNFLWNHLDCNNDIEVGGWRRINLLKPPYNFKYPERIIIEGNTQSNDKDKTMSLWQIKDIPKLSAKVING